MYFIFLQAIIKPNIKNYCWEWKISSFKMRFEFLKAILKPKQNKKKGFTFHWPCYESYE